MSTSFTSSRSSGLKLEMEIFSGGMRGARAESTTPTEYARLGKTTGPDREAEGLMETAGRSQKIEGA